MNISSIRPLLYAAALAALSTGVHAGQVSNLNATAHAAVSITDDAGYAWVIDLTPMVSVDYATGAVSLNTDPAVPINAVGSDTGTWAKVVDATTGKTSLEWHSWTRQDGTVGTDTNGGANAWRSVFTVSNIGGNLDPEMAYGLTFKNNTSSTQTYNFVQGETMDTPMTGAYSLHAELTGSLTNSSPSTTTLDLQQVGGTVQSVWLGNAGVASVNAGVNLGSGATVPVGTVSGAYGTFANTVAGSGSYDYWEFQTSFKLSGGKDVATLSGYAEIVAVPEANGLVLALTGLLAAAGLKTRSRRK